jgi:hypothetical protein
MLQKSHDKMYYPTQNTGIEIQSDCNATSDVTIVFSMWCHLSVDFGYEY